jgi:hypothetical protein
MWKVNKEDLIIGLAVAALAFGFYLWIGCWVDVANAETGNPPMGCLVDFDCGAEFQWTCIKQNDGRGYCVRRQDWYNDDMNDGGGYERDLEQLDDVWNIDED